MASEPVIVIPTTSGAVEVAPSSLPDEADVIIGVMRDEGVPLSTWVQVASAYRRRGDVEMARLVLEATRDPVPPGGEDVAQGKLTAVHSVLALAALRLDEGKLPGNVALMRSGGPAPVRSAITLLNEVSEEAKRIGAYSTIRLARGLAEATRARTLLARGRRPSEKDVNARLDSMFKEYKEVAAAWAKDVSMRRSNGTSLRRVFPGSADDGPPDEQSGRIPIWSGLAGMGVAKFLQGEFLEARALFATAIQEWPSCPAGVRVGLGLCLYRLGHFGAAFQAFRRALELDRNCAEAMVMLGIMHRAARQGGSHASSMARAVGREGQAALKHARALLKHAERLDPDNPAMLVHLADDAFWRWNTIRGSGPGRSLAALQGVEAPEGPSVRAVAYPGGRALLLSHSLVGVIRAGEPLRLRAQGGSGNVLVETDSRRPFWTLLEAQAALEALTDAKTHTAQDGGSSNILLSVAQHTRSKIDHEAGFRSAPASSSSSSSSSDPVLQRGAAFVQAVRQGRVVRLARPMPKWATPPSDAWVVQHRDAGRSAELARRAATRSCNRYVQAEARYMTARAHHVAGRIIDARTEYAAALTLNRRLAPARLGQAQCLLRQGKLAEAEKELKALQQLRRDADSDGFRLLSAIAVRKGDVNGARRMARKAVEATPTDPRPWLAEAELLQSGRTRHELSRARRAYAQAVERLERYGMGVPAALLLNHGALVHRLGDLRRADELYERALAALQADVLPFVEGGSTMDEVVRSVVLLSPGASTLLWNWARLDESAGRVDRATQRYRALLAAHPLHGPSMLRLAAIARDSGDVDGARAWLEAASALSATGASASATAMHRDGSRDASVPLAVLGPYASAAAPLVHAVEGTSEASDALWTLAEMDPERAAEHLRQVIALRGTERDGKILAASIGAVDRARTAAADAEEDEDVDEAILYGGGASGIGLGAGGATAQTTGDGGARKIVRALLGRHLPSWYVAAARGAVSKFAAKHVQPLSTGSEAAEGAALADASAAAAWADVSLAAAQAIRSPEPGSAEARRRAALLHEAFTTYKKVLQVTPGHAPAAVGLHLVSALDGRDSRAPLALQYAREGIMAVRESMPDLEGPVQALAMLEMELVDWYDVGAEPEDIKSVKSGASVRRAAALFSHAVRRFGTPPAAAIAATASNKSSSAVGAIDSKQPGQSSSAGAAVDPSPQSSFSLSSDVDPTAQAASLLVGSDRTVGHAVAAAAAASAAGAASVELREARARARRGLVQAWYLGATRSQTRASEAKRKADASDSADAEAEALKLQQATMRAFDAASRAAQEDVRDYPGDLGAWRNLSIALGQLSLSILFFDRAVRSLRDVERAVRLLQRAEHIMKWVVEEGAKLGDDCPFDLARTRTVLRRLTAQQVPAQSNLEHARQMMAEEEEKRRRLAREREERLEALAAAKRAEEERKREERQRSKEAAELVRIQAQREASAAAEARQVAAKLEKQRKRIRNAGAAVSQTDERRMAARHAAAEVRGLDDLRNSLLLGPGRGMQPDEAVAIDQDFAALGGIKVDAAISAIFDATLPPKQGQSSSDVFAGIDTSAFPAPQDPERRLAQHRARVEREHDDGVVTDSDIGNSDESDDEEFSPKRQRVE